MSNKNRTDKILVVDVEATCWDEGSPPEGERNEIIEIGVCELRVSPTDGQWRPPAEMYRQLRSTSIMVKPATSTISEFCTKLTTITPEMVEDAPSFTVACQRLRQEFTSHNVAWASWGDYDRIQFKRDCEEVPCAPVSQSGEFSSDDRVTMIDDHPPRRPETLYPFGRRHLNIKTLFAHATTALKEVSVSEALEQLGMEFEGTLHRGGDDAFNIARIYAMILNGVTLPIANPA